MKAIYFAKSHSLRKKIFSGPTAGMFIASSYTKDTD